jgi:glucosyl-3-phosphoglycerate synthase
MLSEVYTKTSINRVAQVELLDTYEHKHQVLDTTQPREGLIRMANEIAKTLFRVLSQDGIVMSGSFFRTLQTTYIQESRFAIEKYNALALINCLKYDRHAEIAATEIFVEALKRAIEEFMADPVGIPLLSAWVRVRAAIPDFHKRLAEAVDEDNA